MDTEFKTCHKCGQYKPESDFYKNSISGDGFSSICKDCANNLAKNHYWKNREQRIAQQMDYTRKNKEKVAAYQKMYRDAHKDTAKKYKKEHYEQNKEQIIARQKEYAKRESTKKLRAERRKRRIASDELYALTLKLRGRIYQGYKHTMQGKLYKSKKSEELLGATFQQVLDYLGPQPGPEYCIDHICPLAQAQNEEELEKLFHYSNQRWLLESENAAKQHRRTPEGEELCQILLGRPWLEPTLPQQPLDIAPSPCYNI
jgi:hypothetical protein